MYNILFMYKILIDPVFSTVSKNPSRGWVYKSADGIHLIKIWFIRLKG
jgi:hypothetical protein